ncbi:MAG: FtsQ-type POTRA domain-containing protein [Acidobacteria bacterium]|nr:FtsQ-type POTRA domain-containing protein [Acidobacteriota bacterium]NIM60262.1 FtsQ-type POTRA domain-containing protein [Acidobacteriota bacterium]NIO60300.1 FtsQ-type POTRA domain-containing protein [Acidobacteriota bacterium]NIQ31355.1 FtsQ-type POTRA domain-containing protein [Acidobacteriota bacterium]NIQ86578.1 FtsQ-type POTRA domain-containing protein [Acidobacteriota bacterium]
MTTEKRKPILADMDQKYWRRKANQRVRKQRLTRKLIGWSGILLANALIACGIVYGAIEASSKLLGGPEFAIDTFRIERVERASVSRIQAQLKRRYAGRNIFSVNLYEIERVAALDPWVRSATVKRVLPGTIRVRVVERRPLAVALVEGVAHLVDREGYVIGLTGSGADNLPVISGLDRLEREDLIGALRRGVRMVERLNARAPRFAERLAELNVSRPAQVAVRTLGGGPRLLLDPERIERNVDRWLDLRRAISNRTGALDYVDLRWSQRIVVKPMRP